MTLIAPEKPNLNTGTPPSSRDDEDIKGGLDHDPRLRNSPSYCAGNFRRSANAPGRSPGPTQSATRRCCGFIQRDLIAIEAYRDAHAAQTERAHDARLSWRDEKAPDRIADGQQPIHLA